MFVRRPKINIVRSILRSDEAPSGESQWWTNRQAVCRKAKREISTVRGASPPDIKVENIKHTSTYRMMSDCKRNKVLLLVDERL